MKRYYYLRMGDLLDIWATDPEILKWIFEEVKKLVPSCSIRREEHDITGERVSFQLHRLQGKDSDVYRWLLKQLPKEGWRLIDLSATRSMGDSRVSWSHSFEKEIEE